MRIAVITGASSGMGEEFARRLLTESDGFAGAPFDEIWLIARSEAKLKSLSEELGPDKYRVLPLDLTSPEDISHLAGILEKEQPQVGLLINSAGMGKLGSFASHSMKDVDTTVTLNCTALSEVTHMFLPYMIKYGDSLPAKKGPRIINIASSAGFLPQPNFALYAATKSFVISLSRALHVELKPHHITVTCVCPGPVDTNFVKISKNDPNATITGFKAKFVTTVDKLIPASLRAAKKGKRMLVYGFGQKMLHLASKILPTNLILYFEKGMN
ncbi:MAG: SDR family NAD(P)-dependent oxidoreductase [Clostridiales bacterium]|nr:SDR family NAD(P)-dependent oxidoreductase [Clostridiales bacterium]